MKIFRALVGVVVGYLVYAISSMLLVGLVMGQKGPIVIVIGCVALAAIGWVAGFLAIKIAGGLTRPVIFVLAALVAAATIANLAMQLGAEPTWYKVGTLLLTVPLILVAGLRSSGNGPGA